MVSRPDIADFMEEMREACSFLSSLFLSELSEEALDALSTSDLASDTGNPKIDEGYGLIRRYLSFPESDRRCELACEYARIFLAAGIYDQDRATAVPYESVFTSDDGIMMQEARDHVVAVYREHGFAVDPSLHEPEDHIGFELAFLGEMARQCALDGVEFDDAGLKESLIAQRDFLDGHILNWLPKLASVAEGYATNSFYPGIFLVAMGVLEDARTFLSEAIDGLDG